MRTPLHTPSRGDHRSSAADTTRLSERGALRVLVRVPRPARDLEGCSLVAHRLVRRHRCDAAFSSPDGLTEACLRNACDAVVFDVLADEARARQARLAKQLGSALPQQGVSALSGGTARGTS